MTKTGDKIARKMQHKRVRNVGNHKKMEKSIGIFKRVKNEETTKIEAKNAK